MGLPHHHRRPDLETPTQPAVGDTTISADDLSGLISFQGKIGIMYSDEGDQKFSFAVHSDGDPD